MVSCNTCDSIPSPLARKGNLYLWPPTAHTLGKIRALKQRAKIKKAPNAAADVAAIAVDTGMLETLLLKLTGVLTEEEVKDTRALFMDSDREPGLGDFGHIRPLSELVAFSDSAWLMDILRENRLISHFQPIVFADDTGRPFGHEALLRAWDADGDMVAPGLLFDRATQAGVLFQLDRLARTCAVEAAAKYRLRGKLFINFTPTSIYDPRNCLRTTLNLIDTLGVDRSQIVFEVIETEKVADMDHLTGVLSYYRRNGFKVALDDLGGGYSALSMLPDLRPNYVKIDRALITDIDKKETKAVITRRIVDMCHDLDIQVIAEGIETEREEAVLRDIRVDYLQGFYYGRPQAEPVTEKLAPPEKPAA